MSPPIFTPDGSEVSEIVLPDGATASEVIDPDGDVVFEAGGDIPDSVDAQYHATTWTQGDSTWQDGATDDGAQDMSLNGDHTATTLSDGSEALAGDGSGDNGTATLPDSVSGSGLESFSIEFVMSWAHSIEKDFCGVWTTNDNQNLSMAMNRNSSFASDDGNIFFDLGDNSGNRLIVSPTTNPGLNDGNRHDISYIVNDATANDVEIIIDGTSVDVTVGTGDSPSDFVAWDADMGFWTRNRPANGGLGGTIGEVPADVGAIWIHGSSIGSQTIGNYPDL